MVGVPHRVLGEDAKAVVVAARGVSAAELEAFCRARLADYKVPRTLRVRGRAAAQRARQGAEARAARGGAS